MLLLLIYIFGPVTGYLLAYFLTVGFFKARAAVKQITLSPERTYTV